MAISIREQWNSANAITTARIACVPFFAWALLHDGGTQEVWRWVAAGLFAVAAGTDKLDGYLARKHNLITDLGKLLDPIADKLLVGTALVGLSIIGELWWWVTIVILVRELGITVLRFLMLRYVVLPASRGGKLKTMVQSFAIVPYLAPLWVLPQAVTWVAVALMAAALVITVVTGLDYVVRIAAIYRRARVQEH
ncbi:MAG: CDP-diacylglycerol--glycerol-3-phosphate 3-phosphatidyltransferase [Cellulomonadaceae bacterium]